MSEPGFECNYDLHTALLILQHFYAWQLPSAFIVALAAFVALVAYIVRLRRVLKWYETAR